MKKIIFIISTLFAAIIAMAYLYFSKLNIDTGLNDTSLYAATTNSPLVFSVQNDESIFKILEDQLLFRNLLGEDKYNQILSLKTQIADRGDLNQFFSKKNIYISFHGNKQKEIDFLLSTQTNVNLDSASLFNSLKTAGIAIDSSKHPIMITLPDERKFYIGFQDDLFLISPASTSITNAMAGLKDRTNYDFIEEIKSAKRFGKNNLANLYMNFSYMPDLLKTVSSNKLSRALALFENQKAYALLNYNFGKEHFLLNGNTVIGESGSYYNLFKDLKPQEISIKNILPANTANYVIYAIDDYRSWINALNKWFSQKKESEQINERIKRIKDKYGLDLNLVFPYYFKNQLVTFQLKTGEVLGAVSLSNGDKVSQLFLDLSKDYSSDIKLFKESDILYSYFGEPFQDFKRPYYTIIDNYMVFSNYASTLQVFLNNYNKDNQLVNTESFISLANQLGGTSNISIYVNHSNSERILQRSISTDFFRHFNSDEGLKKFNSFIYQMSGDNGKFQTNILLNADSLQVKATN